MLRCKVMSYQEIVQMDYVTFNRKSIKEFVICSYTTTFSDDLTANFFLSAVTLYFTTLKGTILWEEC